VGPVKVVAVAAGGNQKQITGEKVFISGQYGYLEKAMAGEQVVSIDLIVGIVALNLSCCSTHYVRPRLRHYHWSER
jgi:hypothetical protein